MTPEQRQQFIIDGVEYRTGYINDKGHKIVYRYFIADTPMVLWIAQTKGKYPTVSVVNERMQLVDGVKTRCPFCTLKEFIDVGEKRGPGRPKKPFTHAARRSASMARSAANKENKRSVD
jgi:hypothetical protein